MYVIGVKYIPALTIILIFGKDLSSNLRYLIFIIGRKIFIILRTIIKWTNKSVSNGGQKIF